MCGVCEKRSVNGDEYREKVESVEPFIHMEQGKATPVLEEGKDYPNYPIFKRKVRK